MKLIAMGKIFNPNQGLFTWTLRISLNYTYIRLAFIAQNLCIFDSFIWSQGREVEHDKCNLNRRLLNAFLFYVLHLYTCDMLVSTKAISEMQIAVY